MAKHPEELVDEYPEMFEELLIAIEQIAKDQTRLAKILEFRFILGLSVPETAKIMNYSDRHMRRFSVTAMEALEQILKADD